ncbi:MAG: N-sulfoglucosamine sulfohydrolase [Halioglobus sp.]|jgi:N-sulfoglucosamine sulfohydrolase
MAVSWCIFSCVTLAADTRPNFLLITVDDMNTDSVGVYGASVPETTPHIDQLADAGLRFNRAHVQIANCTPSRNVMWSGRYPHTNKVEGFYQVGKPGYKTLSDFMQEAGYFTAIRHKVHSSTPYHPYNWDLILDVDPAGVKLDRYDPRSYGVSTQRTIESAKAAGKPFSLTINIADAHSPFYGLDKEYKVVEDSNTPSRIYSADEVFVPGYLVDDPIIREELSHYYSSVRRADDAVGYILDTLQKSGEADNTVVMFISDHGMAFPFAKTQLYHHSTWTPLIFRWPESIKAGAVDGEHMVSAVDILPTLLEIAGATTPAGIEGRSFLPLLKGHAQSDRDKVFKEYHENSSGSRSPMRAVQSSKYLYIFNPWSDGSRKMDSATFATNTFSRMMELSGGDKELAQRMNLLRYRVPEEFYDVRKDPNCLVNLIADPAYQKDIESLQESLRQHLEKTSDTALIPFVNRTDKTAIVAYMNEQDLSLQRRRGWIQAIAKGMKSKSSSSNSEPKKTVD